MPEVPAWQEAGQVPQNTLAVLAWFGRGETGFAVVPKQTNGQCKPSQASWGAAVDLPCFLCKGAALEAQEEGDVP